MQDRSVANSGPILYLPRIWAAYPAKAEFHSVRILPIPFAILPQFDVPAPSFEYFDPTPCKAFMACFLKSLSFRF
jgi:hypothetical protein